VDFGLLFPLVIVPLGIIGSTNGYNMLAGYNGLEAGMGVIILTTLSFIAWLMGSGWLSMLSLSMVFALLAFLCFNRFPARVFPGDSLTYSVGAMIACVAILGNMERVALILFIPYFFDMLMFIRFRFFGGMKNVEAFAKVGKDGSLEPPHDKTYDLTHLAIKILRKAKKKVYERDVVSLIFVFELVLVAIVLYMWYLAL
jgi:UDP-N-acetylglucosamine--dolichyl-phosphate N-acetylglucosaminephosphotransferase